MKTLFNELKRTDILVIVALLILSVIDLYFWYAWGREGMIPLQCVLFAVLYGSSALAIAANRAMLRAVGDRVTCVKHLSIVNSPEVTSQLYHIESQVLEFLDDNIDFMDGAGRG